MLEQMLRKQYQRIFVDKFAQILAKYVTPTQITFLGGFFGLLIIPALATQHIVLAITLLLLSGYFDTLDGTVARNNNLTSDLGSVLDILTDRCVEFAAIMGLSLVDPDHRALLCLLMLGTVLLCVTSFLMVGVFTPNNSEKSFHYSPGIMERAEAFIFFILMILLPSYFVLIAIIFIILVLATTVIRVYEFSRFNSMKGLRT